VIDRPDPTLDADLLVAYAEGRLDDARRAVVEARLAHDDEARRLVALLAREGEHAAAEPSLSRSAPGRARARRAVAWAAAAVLLVGAGAAAVTWLLPDRPADTGAWLVATAGALAKEAPEDFAGFTPYTLGELAGGADAPLRGGLVVTRPRGLLAGDRPEVTWVPVAGAEAYEVTLTADDGRVLWSRRATDARLPYPADAPALPRGRQVVVEVAGAAALGRVEGRVVATVATAEDEARHRQRVDRLRAAAGDARADLLVAHHALRAGRLLDAERAARAYAARAPDDPLGQATLAHVERRLGLSR
jgi:hypothetical protein